MNLGLWLVPAAEPKMSLGTKERSKILNNSLKWIYCKHLSYAICTLQEMLSLCEGLTHTVTSHNAINITNLQDFLCLSYPNKKSKPTSLLYPEIMTAGQKKPMGTDCFKSNFWEADNI